MGSHAETREVRVRALVTRLHEVQLVQQTFKVAVQIEASWIEPELKEMSSIALPDGSARQILVDGERTDHYTGKLYCYLPPKEGRNEYPQNAKAAADRFWSPRLYFDNMLLAENEESWYRFYDAEPDNPSNPPIVCLLWKFLGTFQEIMELGFFPLDFQNLTMTLVCGHEEVRVTDASAEKRRTVVRGKKLCAKQVELVKNQSSRYLSNLKTHSFLQAHEYRLYPRLNFLPGETREEDSASTNVYPLLKIQMRVRRRPWNWFFNVVLPLFIIQGSLVTSYAITSGLSDRAGVTITLLLAIVAFRYVISEKLPAISYATLIDMYVLSSFLLAALIITDQTCLSVGLYGEHRTSVAQVDGWVEDEFGEWAHTTVEVSAHLLLVLQLWAASHVVIVLAILARTAYFFRDEEHWSHSETVLWVGPLTQDAVKGGGDSEAQLTPEAAAALGDFFAYVLDESVAGLSARCRLNAWTPLAANTSLRNANEGVSEAEFHEKFQYLGTSPFVVATFASPADAKKSLAYVTNVLNDVAASDTVLANEVHLAKAFFRGGQIKMELLDEKYASLRNRRTLARHKLVQNVVALTRTVTNRKAAEYQSLDA